MPLIRVQEINAFSANVISSPLTGYTSAAGTISATDTVLSAIQKLNGNVTSFAPAIGGPITSATAGSVLFATAGQFAQSNTTFFWNASTNNLGIGTNVFTNSTSACIEISDPNGGGVYLTKTGTLVGYGAFYNDGNFHFQGETTANGSVYFSGGSIIFRGTKNGTDNVTFPGTGGMTIAALTTAGTVQTSASGVISSIANTGTGKAVLATSPTLNAPSFLSTLATINATATATAAQTQTGWRTTATAAVTITLPTATLLATQIGVTSAGGQYYDFVVDNSASTSAGVITITLGTGMTVMTAITGENTLTVAIGIVAIYRVVFTSATVAKIGRLI